jgi:hypothetical protein
VPERTSGYAASLPPTIERYRPAHLLGFGFFSPMERPRPRGHGELADPRRRSDLGVYITGDKRGVSYFTDRKEFNLKLASAADNDYPWQRMGERTLTA